MTFAKYKKAAAIILALVLTLQPACAMRPARALEMSSVARVALSDFDWKELASHFSAFSGLFYWISSTIKETIDKIKELGILDFLSFLHESGIVPEIIEKIERDPPGAFSI